MGLLTRELENPYLKIKILVDLALTTICFESRIQRAEKSLGILLV